jgi:hypothetical protein
VPHRKYPHLERYGTDEVAGIDDGLIYVFPKLDGSNASLWFEDGQVCAGSRTRQLSLGSDNAGFYAWALSQSHIQEFFKVNPEVRLFGEWLVPHTLKTYRADAWHQFYVFDVLIDKAFVEWETYEKYLRDFGFQVVPLLGAYLYGSEQDYQRHLETNTYLIKDGCGAGEGIVLKRYDFVNKYGRTTWAKMVRNEFKESNKKVFGTAVIDRSGLEGEIAETFVTDAFVQKTYAKLVVDEPWTCKRIPELLGRTWHDFITEESWQILKQYNNPTIDYKRLRGLVTNRVKAALPHLF